MSGLRTIIVALAAMLAAGVSQARADGGTVRISFVKAGFVVPPRTLVAGIPARIVRELTEQEMAWKVKGTRSYQELTRRSLATMTATSPLAAPEPGRKRLVLGELLPLSELKAGTKG